MSKSIFSNKKNNSDLIVAKKVYEEQYSYDKCIVGPT